MMNFTNPMPNLYQLITNELWIFGKMNLEANQKNEQIVPF